MKTDFSYAKTSNSADGNPNSSAPSAANIWTVEDNVGTTKRPKTSRGVRFFFDAPGDSLTCSITPWIKDSTSTVWVAMAGVTSQTRRKALQSGDIGAVGGDQVFFQVTSITENGDTITAQAPLTVYAEAY